VGVYMNVSLMETSETQCCFCLNKDKKDQNQP